MQIFIIAKKILDIFVLKLNLEQSLIIPKKYMKNNKLTSEDLVNLASLCNESIKNSENRKAALEKIAETISCNLGDYFGPGILLHPDEISIHFIELLDQIVFETVENSSGDDRIRDYVIDNLYSRLGIYLDIFNDKELYKRNLCNRIITNDDTVIIRQFKMIEYLPELLVEFFEQPELQKPILRVLLTFKSDDLLNFYYQIAQQKNPIDIKILALIGLKFFHSKFHNWDQIKEKFNGRYPVIEYALEFDADDITRNKFPNDVYSLLFVLKFIDLNFDTLSNPNVTKWIISVLVSALKFEIDSNLQGDIFKDITNILIYIDTTNINSLLTNDDMVVSLISIIDFLPREYFDRIVMRISLLGEEFIESVRNLISAGRINAEDRTSNTMSFLFFETHNTL